MRSVQFLVQKLNKIKTKLVQKYINITRDLLTPLLLF